MRNRGLGVPQRTLRPHRRSHQLRAEEVVAQLQESLQQMVHLQRSLHERVIGAQAESVAVWRVVQLQLMTMQQCLATTQGSAARDERLRLAVVPRPVEEAAGGMARPSADIAGTIEPATAPETSTEDSGMEWMAEDGTMWPAAAREPPGQAAGETAPGKRGRNERSPSSRAARKRVLREAASAAVDAAADAATMRVRQLLQQARKHGSTQCVVDVD